MFQLLKPGRTIPFMKLAMPATIFSCILIVLSVFTIATKGFNWGLDFTGGTIAELKFSKPADLDAVRSALTKQGLEGAVVQYYGSTKDVVIRIAPKGELTQQKISDGVQKGASELDSAVNLSRIEYVGPSVGEELANQGFLAIMAALGCILIYIAIRFEWRMATGAVMSLGHDVLITLAVFSWTQMEFDLNVLAAVLTVVGYSLNDTIVVFDRVRENARRIRNDTMRNIIDISMTETLSRTLITSGTTLITVIALFWKGGPMIHGFSTALLIGVGFGTYSSIYVASAWAMYLKMSREDLLPKMVEKEGAEERYEP
ncbi:protein translocase subunit SecF [Tolumonas osonensis]|uniref:Protein-export membrane protein SecF n=1 Tax=Tolumonas osonensis TaxID=675874 RepID=A0A841GAH5_9GAMM|nr:protein translocase subunit SecF [Tolumonas osonensis]MBB6056058.1 preprotein translocase subunit SecF [Tolumonas osonensis]